ncbi:MAG: acylphosphatase [Candidatus Wallbacteria bacterium HGW-Wallbacteria-1]|uniref:Acylphosphatase n=1 Tax=Candidatus Wallbacteria bacterium HGW-Wallbacteria-1 TaxID=2013854 RepID=A0A2N1PTD5_9BACT|nr:MAG: acylphosphatase [Candidatus Wallbacteria bacterium HGW-Wallbacteria-1]
MSETVRCLRVTVQGKVQGVAFRWSTVRAARGLKLTGWVRNNPDGSVSCLAEGAVASLNLLLRYLHHGPPLARVDGIISDWSEATGMYHEFEVTH